MIEAWLSWSLMTMSCSPSRVAGTASLAFQQLTKLSDAAVPTRRAQAASSVAVHRERAADEPHRRGAGAEAVECRLPGRDHRRLVAQAEVVVGGEDDDLAAPLHP